MTEFVLVPLAEYRRLTDQPVAPVFSATFVDSSKRTGDHERVDGLGLDDLRCWLLETAGRYTPWWGGDFEAFVAGLHDKAWQVFDTVVGGATVMVEVEKMYYTPTEAGMPTAVAIRQRSDGVANWQSNLEGVEECCCAELGIPCAEVQGCRKLRVWDKVHDFDD